MATTRDMTQAQFDWECDKRNFRPQGFLGFYSLPDVSLCVSIENAGSRRRSQLAYLIDEHRKACDREGITPAP